MVTPWTISIRLIARSTGARPLKIAGRKSGSGVPASAGTPLPLAGEPACAAAAAPPASKISPRVSVSAPPARAGKAPCRASPWPRLAVDKQFIHRVTELGQVAHLVHGIAQRRVLGHVAVAGAPQVAFLRVEPYHPARAALEQVKQIQ